MIFDNVSIQDVRIVTSWNHVVHWDGLDNHVQCLTEIFWLQYPKVIGYTYEDYAS